MTESMKTKKTDLESYVMQFIIGLFMVMAVTGLVFVVSYAHAKTQGEAQIAARGWDATVVSVNGPAAVVEFPGDVFYYSRNERLPESNPFPGLKVGNHVKIGSGFGDSGITTIVP